MIVVAIIAILAAIAVPAYSDYTRKARGSEVVAATGGYKTGVEICAQSTGALTGCDSGTNNIPAAIAAPSGNVNAMSVDEGVITGSGIANAGTVAGCSIVLTPAIQAATTRVIWTETTNTCTK